MRLLEGWLGHPSRDGWQGGGGCRRGCVLATRPCGVTAGRGGAAPSAEVSAAGRRQGRQSALDTRSRSTWRRSTRWVLVVRVMSAPRSWTRAHRVRACRRLLATAWSSPGAPRRGGGLLSSEPGLGTGALDLSTTLRSLRTGRQSPTWATSPPLTHRPDDARPPGSLCAPVLFGDSAPCTQRLIPSNSVGNVGRAFLHPETPDAKEPRTQRVRGSLRASRSGW